VRAVDFHVHVPTEAWVCGCVGPYLPSIERYFRRAPIVESVEELYARYAALDVVGVLLGWDAERATGRDPLDNAELAQVCAESDGQFVGFGCVDPLRPDALERLRAFPALGLRGLKLHPTLQDFDPADPALAPFFATAAELGLVIVTHAGTSALGAGEPGGQGLRIDLARPLLLDPVAARHPDLQIVLAHVGWPWHLEALAMALHKANVWLDISGWRYRYLPDEVLREARTRLRGRFLFGTDFPMFDPARQLEEVDELGLGDDVTERLLRANAAELLGLG